MNNRQNGRRRGRGGQQPRNGQAGPHSNSRLDNRQRGNAAQLLEKYKTLARDAQMQGDRVNTEYYLQFADHYFRVLSENRSRFEEQRPQQRRDEFGQDYGTEDEAEAPQARGYAPRDFNDDAWDDGDDDRAGEPGAAAPEREQAPRGNDQRNGDGRGYGNRGNDSRDARGSEGRANDGRTGDSRNGEGRTGEGRNGEGRGDRRAHQARANGPANGARGAAQDEVAPAPLADASGIDGAQPLIELDRLPPSLAPRPEPVAAAPAEAAEASAPAADEEVAPKRRRGRKPKAAPEDSAPVEA